MSKKPTTMQMLKIQTLEQMERIVLMTRIKVIEVNN
jgi:hypothetical protein